MIDSDSRDDGRDVVDREEGSSSDGAGLSAKRAFAPATIRVPLDVGIEVERTVGGIEMGVLQNGVTYLTPAGLEEAVGASPQMVLEIVQEWQAASKSGLFPRRSRAAFFKEILGDKGYKERELYLEIVRDGAPEYVYPDVVCMAFLEYFAFGILKATSRAVENYRNFARSGFDAFVYKALDFTPPDKWKYVYDRVSLSSGVAPDGYFTISNEVTLMMIELVSTDLLIGDRTLPELNVEKNWSGHWNKGFFDDVYGARITVTSDTRLPWAYPNEALAEFRRWFRHDYLTTRFPRYLLDRWRLLGDQEEPTGARGNQKSKKTKKPAA